MKPFPVPSVDASRLAAIRRDLVDRAGRRLAGLFSSPPAAAAADRQGRGPVEPRRPHWEDRVDTDSRSITRIGLVASLVFIAWIVGFAVAVPLSGAVIAQGFIGAAGRNLQIQHLEGGIIDRILVQEGDRVDVDQPLFVLDSSGATALRNRLRNQLFASKARVSRLAAERDDIGAIAFPAELESRRSEPLLAEILDEQIKEFSTKLEGHRREIAITEQQVAALDEQIRGVSDQKTSSETQLGVVGEELVRRKTLLDRGLANRREYTDFLLSQAQLTGQVAELGANYLTARTQIAEKREQIARQRSRRVEIAAAELNDVRAQISDLEEQLAAAETVLSRVVVRSPNRGIVVRLDYNAKGAVVAPGAHMAEILPTTADLIVEARLTPQDIDAVYINQAATVRFTALNRLSPTVDANVTFVSPDRLVDPRTEQPYYLARLRLRTPLPASIDPAQIYPGMPVESYIKTGDRTFIEYLLKPIDDSLSRAFRES